MSKTNWRYGPNGSQNAETVGRAYWHGAKKHGICSQTYYKWQKRLFANTPAGAQSSAVIYSLIETAKENGLDPYHYLLWVLQSAPKLSEIDATWAEHLAPVHAPDKCKVQ